MFFTIISWSAPLTAENSGVSSWTPQVRSEYLIYTIKRDDQSPRPFHMGVPPGSFGALQQIPKEDCIRELGRS